MISKIKEIYQEKCIVDEMPQYPNDFYWFQTEDHRLVGISKTINPTEKRLLGMMFDEIVAVDFDQQSRLIWLDLLNGNEEALKKINQRRLKFIFFNHRFDGEAKADFELLVKEFGEQYLTLFLNREFGVILDFRAASDKEELEAFVEAARQDFYYELTFYETTAYELEAGIAEAFRLELELFQTYYNRHKLVMEKQDLLLEFLALKVRDESAHESFRLKIKELPADALEAVIAYFENNFNLSTAAKELHMHRNTFMNKLDKFMGTTGLNVKDFGQAVLAYLLIQSMKER